MPLPLPLLLVLPIPPQTVAGDRCELLRAGLDSATTKPPPQADLSHQYHGKVILTAAQPYCTGGIVITVFQDQNSDWALRQTSIGPDLPVAPIERWAYSTTCPAILDWLERLEHLPIRFGIGPVKRTSKLRTPVRISKLHGTEYSVRGFGWVTQPSGAPASLSLSSNDGEIAAWARGLLQATVPCWKAG